jgi:hypothetical protein
VLKDIEGLISKYHQVIDGYLEGADAERLARAQHTLGGAFDSPIEDLAL